MHHLPTLRATTKSVSLYRTLASAPISRTTLLRHCRPRSFSTTAVRACSERRPMTTPHSIPRTAHLSIALNIDFSSTPIRTMSSAKKNIRTVDSNTLSNSSDFVTTHTELDYELSFKKRQLVGTVEHRLRCVSEGDNAVTDEIWLDSSYVEVSSVRVDGKEHGKEEWELEPRTEPFGSRLRVKLGRKYGTGEEVMVKVSRMGTGIRWSRLRYIWIIRLALRQQTSAQRWAGWTRSRLPTRSIPICVCSSTLLT